jgi:low temperature requirement protein LtrA
LGIAGRGDRDRVRAALRTLPGTIVSPVLLVAAGFVHGSTQLALWAVALAILYLTPLVGRMRGFRVGPEHFVERFGLIIIIALGESIVAIGVGASGRPLDAGVIAAALLGVTVAACVWWSYFDWLIYSAQARLAEVTGSERARLARDAYSYLHLPMVAGIVLFAFGLKTTVADVADSLDTIAAVCLCGGIALYLLAHVALRLRVHGGFGRGRPVATLLLLALIPVAMRVPALAGLALVAAVCVGLILYEVLRHRESRAWIRSRRGDFTMEEIMAAGLDRRRRHPRAGSGGASPEDRAGGE